MLTAWSLTAERRAHSGDDLATAGEVPILERRRERNRHERRPDALDRRVQLVESGPLHLRRDLRSEPALLDGFVGDDETMRARDGLDDGVEIQRDERARVDHLGLD